MFEMKAIEIAQNIPIQNIQNILYYHNINKTSTNV